MKGVANVVMIGLGLTLGWHLGKERPAKALAVTDTVGDQNSVICLIQASSRAKLRAPDSRRRSP